MLTFFVLSNRKYQMLMLLPKESVETAWNKLDAMRDDIVPADATCKNGTKCVDAMKDWTQKYHRVIWMNGKHTKEGKKKPKKGRYKIEDWNGYGLKHRVNNLAGLE
eukprot:246830_1